MIDSARVRDYMATSLVTLKPDTEILRALQTLVEKDISGAPVLDEDGRLVGILTERDCMKAAVNATYYTDFGGKVADFMTADVKTVSPDDGIVEMARLFIESHYHRYPVIENSRLVGQISRRDVMRAVGKLWGWH